MSPIDIISARAASKAELSAFDAAEAVDDDDDDVVVVDDDDDDEAVELVSAVVPADEPAASSVIVDAVSQAARKNVAAKSVSKGLNILCSQKDEQTM